MWWCLAPSRPISDFYRYPCIGPPADYAIVLLRAWAKKEYVDPKRIGIWGWVSLVFLKLLFVSNRDASWVPLSPMIAMAIGFSLSFTDDRDADFDCAVVRRLHELESRRGQCRNP